MNNTNNSVSGKSCQTTLEAARPLQAENHADEMFLDVKQIDNYVDSLLEYNGLRKETKEQRARLLLQHLYTAATMFSQMSDEEKLIIAAMQKKLGKNFSPKNFPHTPLEKKKKAKKKQTKFYILRSAAKLFIRSV